MKRLINLHLIATTAVLMSATALAVPPNSDLLNCGNIPTGGDCNAALKGLCDATWDTTIAPVNKPIYEFDFKKQNDRDSLVSKVVGAAIKFDQGGAKRDEQGGVKLGAYGSKVNGMNCWYKSPNEDQSESKPKILCDLQIDLNAYFIAAEFWCPS